MAAVLTYLRSALQQQKQALSPLPVLPVPQACDSSHFSLSLSLSDLLDTLLAPPAWAIFVYQAPQCSLSNRHGRKRGATKTSDRSLRRPCFWPWRGKWRRRACLRQTSRCDTVLHTHTHREPVLSWTLNDTFFLTFFSPPKVIMIFLYPSISTVFMHCKTISSFFSPFLMLNV